MKLPQKVKVFDEKSEKLFEGIWLAVIISFSFFFLFYNAFRFPLPLGYGGLYTLMADQIVDHNFWLPKSVPYYGPGEIPFAYPPLALYVMAVFLKLDISYVTYLRFIPPLFSLLALIPLYFFSKSLTNSSRAAGVVVFFSAVSPSLYVMHTWSAGVVRALAFFFMLCGFLSLHKALEQKSVFWGGVTGVLFGMVTLTHLFYAMFFSIWIASWMLLQLNRSQWRTLLTLAATAIATTVPWLGLMVIRYGMDLFRNAFGSHDNNVFLDVALNPFSLLQWIGQKIMSLNLPLLVYIAAAIGLIYILAIRQYSIPLALFLSLALLTSEGDRFTVLFIALLLGYFSQMIEKWLSARMSAQLALYLLLAFILVQTGYSGFQEIRSMSPIMNRSMFELAEYVQENTPVHARYLFVAGQSEAEWFPYLLRREPFASKWGSEWMGTYYEQRALQISISTCRDTQSVDCLRGLNLNVSDEDVLITSRKQRELSIQIESMSSCARLGSFGPYIIWRAACLK